MPDTPADDLLARIRAAEAKAWWRELTGLVGETDQQLVVIGPRADTTADDLRSLGQVLARWQAEVYQARHVWGLSDLLAGQRPRTPPIYLSVPFPMDRLDECYEPVALVYVAAGTNVEAVTRDLYERLGSLRSKLAWFEHPDAYSYYQR